MFEFHVAREARDRYRFDHSLFAFNGNVIFADFQAARVFAQRMNAARDLLRHPEQAVRASDINAMGLIDEVLHAMVAHYRQEVNPDLNQQALTWLGQQLGANSTAQTLRLFAELFPPAAVYRGDIDLDTYLAGETAGLHHFEITLEETLMLWLANENPAFTPFLELFADDDLEQHTPYEQIIAHLTAFFQGQPGGAEESDSLFDLLRGPTLAAPDSLAGQLEFISNRWGHLLGNKLLEVLRGLDFIAEETKPVFAGPGPVQISRFDDLAAEPEQYSADLDWMPRLVLLARNAYVWLDQLSKQYGRPIATLDQVPDAELDLLAARGITGLWLIGLWERSTASQRIKQMMGNPEAVASAYSLYDYQIAHDLGGPEAMADLRARAGQRGIRMASDMVPNHMAIDSRWVIQHPDWFLSLPQPPYPNYTFSGPDLSQDARVGIFLEDHYYDRSDAAVVFKRVDRWTGDERYIYHGNDGTTMPWNDTAQLNYLRAEVREAVIQTILHVARQFPIIRFDAAMTLAKKHVQRLWFPEPGTGGAIASRAEHGLSKEAFDAAMPTEFWRDVVDRVAVEAPDTLLLAEAFWLLEGYFVRTLGMHRVYNSAFMHMLRDEDNDKYRHQLKSTLEFDPEILKRYVNFMSNPDEATAAEQFGKGDKYFGVATVLATVPGLPMLGHGQFEGFSEKYGMEYRRAYYDETPDGWLIDRHMREITPLFKRRYLFAEVANFLLYDFVTADGGVDENVLAYSNRAGQERSLVLYHNKFADTRGWVRQSAPFIDKSAAGEEKPLIRRTLAEGLGLPHDPTAYLLFRDLITGLEYIRNCAELHEQGLYIELGAYQRHVFLDLRVLPDDADGSLAQVMRYLAGQGVPSVALAVKEIDLQPLHAAFRRLFQGERLQALAAADAPPLLLDEIEAALTAFLAAARGHLAGAEQDAEAILLRRVQALAAAPPAAAEDAALLQTARSRFQALRLLPDLAAQHPWPRSRAYKAAAAEAAALCQDRTLWATLAAWITLQPLAAVAPPDESAEDGQRACAYFDEWLLARPVQAAFQAFGLTPAQAERGLALLRRLLSLEGLPDAPAARARSLFADAETQQFLGVNRFDEVLWYNAEAFTDLINLLALRDMLAQIAAAPAAPADPRALPKAITACHAALLALRQAHAAAGYQMEALFEGMRRGA